MVRKPSNNDTILLMDRDRILRTLQRMAYQIDEDHVGEQSILIAGVKKRGAAIAECLVEALKNLTSSLICQIQISEGTNSVQEVPGTLELPNYFDYSLVVDDVIFSGHTMLGSLEMVSRRFETKILRTAVLVDRGHRMVPVDASFCGINLPTKLDEHVQVCLDGNLPEKVILTTDNNFRVD